MARAFDLLGLGADALRSVPVNAAYEMDVKALETMIAADHAAGNQPFLIVGTAGSVNTGAFDDLSALADLAAAQNMWLHIDGAFGAAGVLSEVLRPRLKGIEQADSIAFDFHKWLHVNYDAGFVLVRDGGRAFGGVFQSAGLSASGGAWLGGGQSVAGGIRPRIVARLFGR